MKQRKLKILMIEAAYPPPVVGGKEKQAHLLARELAIGNASVRALSYRHNGNTSQIHEGIMVERLNPGPFSGLQLLWRLSRLRAKFEFLHIHTPSGFGKFSALVGKALGYKVIFKFPNESLLNATNLREELIWNVLCRMIDLFVVLEDDTKNALLERRISASKIFYASNGVIIHPDHAVSREIASGGMLKILYVGRLVPQKNVRVLIKACASLNASLIDWELVIVGDGSLRGELITLTERLGLSQRVLFLGAQQDPLQYMIAADVLVLPSDKEGMSNVILEAMAAGVPVVATDVGAARRQLGDLGERYLCQPGCPSELAGKLDMLLQDSTTRKKYGNYLKERARALFSITAIAKAYEERYHQIP